jgi:putative lipoic acid-binding regulatory protein
MHGDAGERDIGAKSRTSAKGNYITVLAENLVARHRETFDALYFCLKNAKLINAAMDVSRAHTYYTLNT